MSDKRTGTTSGPSTSSAGASLARISRAQELAAALLESARACGLSLPGSSESCGQLGLWSRTSPAAQSDGSIPCAQNWDGSVMKRFRSHCRRATSEPGTSGDGSSLLPTPSAATYGTSGNGDPGDGRGEYAHKGTPSLHTMARMGTLPTPCARDFKGPTGSPTKGGRNLPRDLGQQTRCLNPRFVEWMMGLPLGWTVRHDCDPLAMPLFPNAPK